MPSFPTNNNQALTLVSNRLEVYGPRFRDVVYGLTRTKLSCQMHPKIRPMRTGRRTVLATLQAVFKVKSIVVQAAFRVKSIVVTLYRS